MTRSRGRSLDSREGMAGSSFAEWAPTCEAGGLQCWMQWRWCMVLQSAVVWASVQVASVAFVLPTLPVPVGVPGAAVSIQGEDGAFGGGMGPRQGVALRIVEVAVGGDDSERGSKMTRHGSRARGGAISSVRSGALNGAMECETWASVSAIGPWGDLDSQGRRASRSSRLRAVERFGSSRGGRSSSKRRDSRRRRSWSTSGRPRLRHQSDL